MASPLATVARYLLPFLVVVMGQLLEREMTSSFSVFQNKMKSTV